MLSCFLLSAIAAVGEETIQLPVYQATAPHATPARGFEGDIPLDLHAAGRDFALSALLNELPGAHAAANQARSFGDTFAIRGLANTPIFGAPALAVYLDDLPLGGAFTFPSDLTGFDRVELFRGPGAGTRFGRSGPGGVLRLSTPAATGRRIRQASFSAGQHGHRELLYEGHAVHARADVFFAAGYRERDGYVQNTRLGVEVDPQETTSLLARARMRPGEAVEITLLLQGLRGRDGAQPLVPLGGPMHEVQRNAEGRTEVDSFAAALTAAWTRPGGRLAATTSFSDWDMAPYHNTLDFGFAELGNGAELRQRNLSEEISFRSAGRGASTYLLGLFVGELETEGAFKRDFGGFVFEHSDYRIANLETAGFGEVSWRQDEDLSLTLGVRVAASRSRFERRESVPMVQAIRARQSSWAALPHLRLRYSTDAATEFFADMAKGRKPGGFSAFTGNARLAPFGREDTMAYELGWSREARGGRMRIATRAYWYDVDGYQIERSFATGSGTDDYLVVNAASARSVGGEFELSWRPFTGLEVAANAGLTKATLRDFTDPYTGRRYDGRRVPFMPSHDLAVRVEYQHAKGGFAGVKLTANGRTHYTEDEEAAFSQPAYELLAARIGHASCRYRLEVSATNLTGTRYYSAITPGTFHGTPGAPRLILAELTFHF